MKKNKQLNNLPYLKDRRRSLRKTLTTAEATMWKVLQKSQFENRKFRRQHSVGPYILDFYCPAEKIALELDGKYHFTEEGIARDKIRDAYLQNHGITVLRIENRNIFNNLQGVLELIRCNFKKTDSVI